MEDDATLTMSGQIAAIARRNESPSTCSTDAAASVDRFATSPENPTSLTPESCQFHDDGTRSTGTIANGPLQSTEKSIDGKGGASSRHACDQPTAELETLHEHVARMFGKYRLERELGRGGMGVVYQATDVPLRRKVAIKTINGRGTASPQVVRRFQTEAAAVAKLDHPGVVAIYEVGVIDDCHYYAMELVEGESLSRRMQRSPPAPMDAAELVRQTADAIHFAHLRGILHRDLKPQNILVDEAGRARVLDFGLAKDMDSDDQLTHTGQLLGTPGYMPPEQAVGNLREIGPAADVYSLGAVLYCLLTGRPPFHASSVAEFVRLVVEEEPLPIRQLNPSVPPDLQAVCERCLRKLPDNRYPTAGELADDLQRFLRREPVRTRASGWLGGLQLWYCRPQRMADAGRVSVYLALILSLWTVAGCSFVLTGLVGVPKPGDTALGIFLGNLLLIVPWAVIGFWTLRRSLASIVVGIAKSASLGCFSLLFALGHPLVSWINLGDHYGHDLYRVSDFSLFFVIACFLFVAYTAALSGWRTHQQQRRLYRSGNEDRQ